MKGAMLPGALGSRKREETDLKPMIEIDGLWKDHDHAAPSDAESASWRNSGYRTPPIPAQAPSRSAFS